MQCIGNIILTYVCCTIIRASASLRDMYPGLYCAVVPLFVVVERIAMTSAVHERLFSQVVEHAEHYTWDEIWMWFYTGVGLSIVEQ